MNTNKKLGKKLTVILLAVILAVLPLFTACGDPISDLTGSSSKYLFTDEPESMQDEAYAQAWSRFIGT